MRLPTKLLAAMMLAGLFLIPNETAWAMPKACYVAIIQSPSIRTYFPTPERGLSSGDSQACQVVGWSRTGSIALLVATFRSVAPDYSFALVIHDLVTDIETQRVEIGVLDEQELNGANGADKLLELLEQKDGELTSCLLRNQIEASGGSPAESFPVQYGDGQYWVQYQVEETEEQIPGDSEADPYVPGSTTTTFFIRKENKQKIITAISSTWGAEVIGWLKSPFEPRIAVFFVSWNSGFEGQNDATLAFAGCHLTAGRWE